MYKQEPALLVLLVFIVVFLFGLSIMDDWGGRYRTMKEGTFERFEVVQERGFFVHTAKAKIYFSDTSEYVMCCGVAEKKPDVLPGERIRILCHDSTSECFYRFEKLNK